MPEKQRKQSKANKSHKSFALFVISVPPPVFKEKLQSREVQEEDTAVLHCQLSQPSAGVKWEKGPQVISPSSKYEIRQEGTVHTLRIYHLKPEESGKNTRDSGNEQTAATLTVKCGLCWVFFKIRNLLHSLRLCQEDFFLLSLTSDVLCCQKAAESFCFWKSCGVLRK